MRKRILSLFLCIVMCLSLIPTAVFAAGSTGSFMEITSGRYLSTVGSNAFNVFMYDNTFSGVFGDSHMAGIEMVLNGLRIATDGDLHLSPAWGQWDLTPAPSRGTKIYDTETNTITVPMTFSGSPSGTLQYDLVASPTENGVRISMILRTDMPDGLAGKARFSMALLPSAYEGKTYMLDPYGIGVYTEFGLFPEVSTAEMAESERVDLPSQSWYVQEWNEDRGDAQPLPFAVGKRLNIAPDDKSVHFLVSAEAGGMLELYDGRAVAQDGWYVLSTPITATRSGEIAAQWNIVPDVEDGWVCDPVISYSQVGYSPNQQKFAVIQLDKWDNNYASTASLWRVDASGRETKVSEKPLGTLTNWMRYKYVRFDFSEIEEVGLYRIHYGSYASDVFPISTEVYDDIWQSTLSGWLAVQMDHIAVRENDTYWHGAAHMDDAYLSPVGSDWYAGKSGWFDGMNVGTIPASVTAKGFSANQHVDGLNKGGWADAGDNDVQMSRNFTVLRQLIEAAEYCNNMDGYDDLTVVWDQETGGLVEMHRPDGIPDIIQQIVHGSMQMVAQYEVLGGVGGTLETRSLREYTHTGDMASETDGYIYDPSLAVGEIVQRDGKVYSGVEDDRFLLLNGFYTTMSGRAADFAAVAYLAAPYYPDYAVEVMNCAQKIWADENLGNSTDFNRTVQYYLAAYTLERHGLRYDTCEERYNSAYYSARLSSQLSGALAGSISSYMPLLALLPVKDASFRAQVAAKAGSLSVSTSSSPYGVNFTTGSSWGNAQTSYSDLRNMAFLYYNFPEQCGNYEEKILNGVNYMLGLHPVSNSSYIAGVGKNSALYPYGAARADGSYVPGAIFPGHITFNDYAEFLGDSYGYIISECESILDYASKWIPVGLVAGKIAHNDNDYRVADSDDFESSFDAALVSIGSDGYFSDGNFDIFMYSNTASSEIGDQGGMGIQLVMNGNRIATDGDLSRFIVSTRLDSAQPVNKRGTRTFYSDKITVPMTMPKEAIPGDPNMNSTAVERIVLNGCGVPLAGKTAGDLLNITVPYGAHYKIYDKYWYCDSDQKKMASSDVFAAGKEYSFSVILTADEFDVNVTAVPYGNGAVLDEQYSRRTSTSTYQFWSVPTAAKVPVEVNGCSLPIVGMTAGALRNFTVPGGSKYSVTDSYWYCDSDSVRLSDTSVFEAGKQYSFKVSLTAASGYNFTGGFVVLNGGDVKADNGNTNIYSSSCSIWSEPVTANADVTVTGYVKPVVGQKADTLLNVSVPEGSPYYITDTYAYCDTDHRYISADEIIEAGKQYSVLVNVKHNSSFRFGSATVQAVVGAELSSIDSWFSANDAVFWTEPTWSVESVDYSWLGCADEDFLYELIAEPEEGGIKLTVKLSEKLPSSLVGSVGFNLELLPAAFMEKSFMADTDGDGKYDDFGIFPRDPKSELVSVERIGTSGQLWYVQEWNEDRGDFQPLPFAEGTKMTFAAEDDNYRLRISCEDGLALYDGRCLSQENGYVLRTLIPADATEIVWHISPDTERQWIRDPVIAHSQIGYEPIGEKIATIEVGPDYDGGNVATLKRLNEDGSYTDYTTVALSDYQNGTWERYRYRYADFSFVTARGIYVIDYDGYYSDPFVINGGVYANIWQSSLVNALAVQMDHMTVRDRYRIWNNDAFRDDALQAPMGVGYFDGFSTAGTDYANAGTQLCPSGYKAYEHIPGLAVGGFRQAGESGVNTNSVSTLVSDLALTYQLYGNDWDTLTVDWNTRTVEMYRPDGVPDLIQLAKHGALQLLAQFDATAARSSDGYGFLASAIITPSLYQYQLSGDYANATDGLIYDPDLDENEVWGLYSGKLDDRLALFTKKNAVDNRNAASALAAAADILKGIDDETADRCLEWAEKIWAVDGNNDFTLAVNLLRATGKTAYKQVIMDYLDASPSAASVRSNGFRAALVIDQLDTTYQEKFRLAVENAASTIESTVSNNPFGYTNSSSSWGGSNGVVSVAIPAEVLHLYYPDSISSDPVFRAVNYILGNHPADSVSYVAGVGYNSVKHTYGANRANGSYVAGSIVPGYIIIGPDCPEFLYDYNYMIPESECTIDALGEWILLAMGADPLAREKDETCEHDFASAVSDDGYTVYYCRKCGIYYLAGAVLSGNVTSFGDSTQKITIKLTKQGESSAAHTTTVTGNSTSYSITGVAAGTYTLTVSKENHVTREYTVTIGSENVTQDVKIHLLGDINGDGRVNTSDVGKANAHAKKTSLLTGYELACADVNGDGRVNTSDVGKLNAHAKKTSLLW